MPPLFNEALDYWLTGAAAHMTASGRKTPGIV
jgi:hypothetical protein